MLARRMGRPGLVGLAARTAVVAGTATAVSGSMNRRQQGRAAQQQELDAYQQQQQQAQAMANAQQAAYQQQAYQQQQAPQEQPASGVTDETINQLQRLGQLHEQGILTDEEFASQKAKLLGM